MIGEGIGEIGNTFSNSTPSEIAYTVLWIALVTIWHHKQPDYVATLLDLIKCVLYL